jgi:hypothetical protein
MHIFSPFDALIQNNCVLLFFIASATIGADGSGRFNQRANMRGETDASFCAR